MKKFSSDLNTKSEPIIQKAADRKQKVKALHL